MDRQKKEIFEIHITDPDKFTDVCLVIDQEDFIHRALQAIGFLKNIANKSKLETELTKEIAAIIEEFNLPPHYHQVVREVLLYKSVSPNAYTSAYYAYLPKGKSLNNRHYIVLHEGSRQKDVLEAFNKFNSMVKMVKYGQKHTPAHVLFYAPTEDIDVNLAKASSVESYYKHEYYRLRGKLPSINYAASLFNLSLIRKNKK